MIPIMLKSGRMVSCGPSQTRIHLQHCPSCGDQEVMEVVRPLSEHITCPACGPTSDLWRLLERGQA